MSLDSKIAAKQAQIKVLMGEVDGLLKLSQAGSGDGAVRTNEQLLDAGKRLDKITDLNLKIAKLRGQVNKLEDKKLVRDKIFKKK